MTVTGKTFSTAWDAIADAPEEAAVLKAWAGRQVEIRVKKAAPHNRAA